MSTLIQKLQFSLTKKQILSEKTDDKIRWDLAGEIARTNGEILMADPMLLSFLYESVKKPDSLEAACSVLFELFARQPRKSIGQKNLMVTIRRIAIDGHAELSQKAATILIDRNDPKSLLGSKPFMEMFQCIASFDEDGTVSRMLDRLETEIPIECEKSHLFAQARENNIESLTKQDPDIDIDLTDIEKVELEVDRSGKEPKNVGQIVGLSNLWAGPVESSSN